eukprot:647697-Pelagomonas_calceolata.AAC.4
MQVWKCSWRVWAHVGRTWQLVWAHIQAEGVGQTRPSLHGNVLLKGGLEPSGLTWLATSSKSHRGQGSPHLCMGHTKIHAHTYTHARMQARIYALGTPRSVEVRHEYHKRQGWDLPEYSQAVSWRLNQPEECGRRFMPIMSMSDACQQGRQGGGSPGCFCLPVLKCEPRNALRLDAHPVPHPAWL